EMISARASMDCSDKSIRIVESYRMISTILRFWWLGSFRSLLDSRAEVVARLRRQNLSVYIFDPDNFAAGEVNDGTPIGLGRRNVVA
uniref:hypothetical protein n=1 Tax=Klebsiella aerogenes TaxID=548 RepID=UPI0019545D17